MSEHYLLLGAGFSRNWGGWLSNEVNEFLLGDLNLSATLKEEILCNRQGFEGVLGRLQNAPQEHDKLQSLQAALRVMFLEMNGGLLERARDFDDDFKIRRFLAKFDAIFTLNQDVFLEHCYLAPKFDLSVNCPGKWSHSGRPGFPMMRYDLSDNYTFTAFSGASEYRIDPAMQPYFKLHGSSDLLLKDGSELLIMGTNKMHQIAEFSILKAYQNEFRKRLSTGSARLMIIGYSFMDEHIDDIILDCCTNYGLKLFIINPYGVEVINQKQYGNVMEPYGIKYRSFIPSLIGASRRNLPEIIRSDQVEFRKIDRFFST